MNYFKKVSRIAWLNIKKWRSSLRIIMIGILLVIFIHANLTNLIDFLNSVDIPITPWVFPFLLEWRSQKLLLFLPLIFLFSDAPFIDKNQLYVVLRAGRLSWASGQILYILFASFIYFFIIIILTILMLIPNVTFDLQWGDAITTLSKTNAGDNFGVIIPFKRHILDYFSPLQAMFYSYLLSSLIGSILGMLMFVINVVSKKSVLGIIITSSMVLFDVIIWSRGLLLWFSPVSWATLSAIRIDGARGLPNFTQIMVMISLIITTLITLIFWLSKKMELNELHAE
ncbi:hypothetical protein [Fundicoccus culcitae]|uniref:ABC transporter permease n=1 Tax=Fundicoccus culcitae TaxID=2969821 RepID=A0ABY5P4D3_9LACT|nr:hypothetical protein [Fundicoccus culcitae]UUX33609.1 hypothetical protein NRE15_11985 [Fundicoccus culcitae]